MVKECSYTRTAMGSGRQTKRFRDPHEYYVIIRYQHKGISLIILCVFYLSLYTYISYVFEIFNIK